MADYERTLEGVADLARKAEPMPKYISGKGKRDNYLASRKENEGFSWDAGVNFDQAIVMAEHGWPEGAQKARKVLDTIQVPMAENYASTTVSDVQGSYVDVGAYVEGVPECMVDFREDKRTVRFARIRINGVMSAGITTDEAMRRGVGIAAIIDALETQGVRCDVDMIYRNTISLGGSGSSEDTLQYTVPLKRATDALNLDVVAFVTAHPACFRRLVFGIMEHEPEDVRQIFGISEGGGYGRVTKLKTEPGTLTFQGMAYGEDWSKNGTEKAIQSALAQFVGGTK